MTPAIQSFLRAASDGDANRVRGLLAQGTDVDSVNRAGQSALMLASGFKRHDVVRVLVAANANPDIQDDLGLTAFDWANNDPEIITLLNEVKPQVAAPQLAETAQKLDNVNPVTPTTRNVQPVLQTPNESPQLKGLAGAILRDRKPRLHEYVAAPRTPAPPPPPAPRPQPPPLPPPPVKTFDPEPERLEPAAGDETLDRPLRELNEDTAAPRPALTSSRIFNLSAANEAHKPLSKVEVAVPEQPRRSYAFVWLLFLVVLFAAGFGTYRLVKSWLLPKTATSVDTPPPQPEATPSVSTVKARPTVSGDVAGAELHLPDAIYPAEAQGKSGTVHVQVQVSSKGIVFGAKAIDGDEVFREAAEKAAHGSAFSPDKLQSRQHVEGIITYTFTPNQSSPSTTSAHGVTAVAGGPLSGAEANLVEPDYPSSAKQDGAVGEFTVVVRVNRAGHVRSWRPLNGDNRLRQSVIKAARKSTFSPSKLPGNGDVVGTITYIFN